MPPILFNIAATGVMLPNAERSSADNDAISTPKPSIKNASAIKIPPPTTKGSI